MKLLTGNLLTKFYTGKLVEPAYNDVVGISVTMHGIAMAHITGSSPASITVNSYRHVAVENSREQLDALQEYIEEYQLIDCPCSYVLPIDKYVLGIIETPNVTAAEVPEAVRMAVKDFVDYPIAEAVVDIFPLPFKRIEDNKDVSYAVIAHSTVIYEAIDFIKKAGLKLKYIDIHELCLRNLAMLHAESNKGALLLRLYANGGHVVLLRGHDVIMTRRIDLAMKNLLNGGIDIASEQQKIQALLDDLALDLQRSMDYCSGVFRQIPINCVMLLPTEFDLDSINVALTKHLGMPIHSMDLTELMYFKRAISNQEQVRCLLAIGAGLRQIKVPEE